MRARVVLVMGVSGAGKTTLGRALAERLEWDFQDGDDLHPARNVEKMRSGAPLADEDRIPWLDRVRAWVDEHLDQGRSGVIACSALKRRYRQQLGADRAAVVLVYLVAEPGLLEDRLRRRPGHFMPATLLPSQLAALEPPGDAERAIVVQAAEPLETQVDEVIEALDGR